MTQLDIQELFKAMSAGGRLERGNYHVTLGELINTLENLPREWSFSLEIDGLTLHLAEAYSYRGYYDDLSFQTDTGPSTVGETKDLVAPCLGREFTGYKGGDYRMDERTPLWISSYGDASGRAIVGISVDRGSVKLVTKVVD